MGSCNTFVYPGLGANAQTTSHRRDSGLGYPVQGRLQSARADAQAVDQVDNIAVVELSRRMR